MLSIESRCDETISLALRHPPSPEVSRILLDLITEMDQLADDGHLTVEFVRNQRQRIFSDVRHRVASVLVA